MNDRHLSVDQKLAVQGKEDRLLYPLAGEGTNRIEGFPERNRDILPPVTNPSPEKDGPYLPRHPYLVPDSIP